MIAIRPVLPLVNYAVNYNYIATNLCQNKNKPRLNCNGKCYVAKELAKTEKQSAPVQTVKISGLDFFLSNEVLSLIQKEPDFYPSASISGYFNFYHSEYFFRIFHPPLV